MENKRINQIYEFGKEINKFKSVYRLSQIGPKERQESDAEHTWHLCMLVWMFCKEIEAKVDLLKCLKLALVHDLVEIYAGDTWGLTTEDVSAQKQQKELQACEFIRQSLPEDIGSEIKDLWLEYEARETEEAKYVWAMDKLHPRIQWLLSEGDLSDNKPRNSSKAISQEQMISDVDNTFQLLLETINEEKTTLQLKKNPNSEND